MSGPVSHSSIVGSIVRKDMTQWSRDRLWVAMTVLVLIMFGGLFWLLPDSVEETIYVGVYPPELSEALTEATESDEGLSTGESDAAGVKVVEFDSEDEMVTTIEERTEVDVDGEEREVTIGLAFPKDFIGETVRGETTEVTVYVEGTVPEEITNAMSALVRELAYGAQTIAMGENPEEAFPVTFPDQETIVLGVDRAGNQIPFNERMRPLFAFMIIIVESLALASLIAVEVQEKTMTAMLVTPARMGDVLTAKGITGTFLAFSQGVLILIITRAFVDSNALALLLATLIGAIMAAGLGMLTGAAGKDFMGTLFYGILYLVPLFIPAFAVMFPGSTSPIVQIIPTWGVITAMEGAASYDMGLGELAVPLAAAAAWCVAIFALGWIVLRRRVQSL
jgi:ABC-2 type transport system permease protein